MKRLSSFKPPLMWWCCRCCSSKCQRRLSDLAPSTSNEKKTPKDGDDFLMLVVLRAIKSSLKEESPKEIPVLSSFSILHVAEIDTLNDNSRGQTLHPLYQRLLVLTSLSFWSIFPDRVGLATSPTPVFTDAFDVLTLCHLAILLVISKKSHLPHWMSNMEVLLLHQSMLQTESKVRILSGQPFSVSAALYSE
jgi:hypothetical protein